MDVCQVLMSFFSFKYFIETAFILKQQILPVCSAKYNTVSNFWAVE